MKKILPAGVILIPDNAQKVFTGKIFDVYQWSQKMFDGSEAIFELLKRPDTVQIIAAKDSQIALVRDEQPGRAPRLHFPGGRADEDASWLEAAQRELLEETGMKFKSWKLIAVYQPIPKAEWFTPWFLARDFESQQAQALDVGEKIKLEWHDFNTARNIILSGEETTMNYAIPVFLHVHSLKELLDFPEFEGQRADR